MRGGEIELADQRFRVVGDEMRRAIPERAERIADRRLRERAAIEGDSGFVGRAHADRIAAQRDRNTRRRRRVAQQLRELDEFGRIGRGDERRVRAAQRLFGRDRRRFGRRLEFVEQRFEFEFAIERVERVVGGLLEDAPRPNRA